MKYVFLLALAIISTACSQTAIQKAIPSHVGIAPSMEWEVQEGSKTKYKPRVGSSIDWNF